MAHWRWRRRPAGLTIDKLALYEVPYSVTDEAAAAWQGSVEQLGSVLEDGRTGDGEPPTDRLARIAQPTLVATGEPGGDPHTERLGDDFFTRAADAIAAAIPGAERRTFERQGHVADPSIVAPLSGRFFAA